MEPAGFSTTSVVLLAQNTFRALIYKHYRCSYATHFRHDPKTNSVLYSRYTRIHLKRGTSGEEGSALPAYISLLLSPPYAVNIM